MHWTTMTKLYSCISQITAIIFQKVKIIANDKCSNFTQITILKLYVNRYHLKDKSNLQKCSRLNTFFFCCYFLSRCFSQKVWRINVKSQTSKTKCTKCEVFKRSSCCFLSLFSEFWMTNVKSQTDKTKCVVFKRNENTE